MNKILDGLRQIRASNIIFLFMIPVIIYFLITSRNYLPALKSVLGVENNATELLASFLLLCIMATLTLAGSLNLFKSIRIDQKQEIISRARLLATTYFFIAFALSLVFVFTSFLNTYAICLLYTSDAADE